ncbi:hypothetical protein PHYSODRAFT_246082 [Phytophthora sojae]|uniref:NADH:flavin oxidoreductase/NADH oxidase N-terminal domain-containing protein n=1 Tax=Phytophthora sojae (strain P6497) TaxID=1094619 RepID=G5ACV2_PHYSP|nr:hypothetical protein PHYSODRAFT_246082 [Phytophthora sojae]EGZ06614.1 hypothetical protein PHYSODRAFT_246082 [Phytophthora sojae]|eukprot:XP_009537378.1 hypothetical protein PHYSODRAFT_246082 [Phytophthora sojae]
MADKPPSPTDQEAKAESNDEAIFTPRPVPEVTQPVDPVHQKEPAFYVGGVSPRAPDDDSEGVDVPNAAGVITGGSSSPAETEMCSGVITGGEERLGLRLTSTRYPWLDDYNPFMWKHRRNGRGRELFDCSELHHVVILDGWDPHAYLIDLFFPKRFYAKSKAMKLDPLARTSPDALSDAWDVFVQSLVDDEASWMLTFHSLKNTFMTYNVEGEKVRVHQQSIGEGSPCCVLSEQECPMCYADSLKAADHIRRGTDGMSDRLVRYIKQLDRRWARHTLRREEDRRRVRALQGYIVDDITLAQAEHGKTDQRIRDIESDIYLNGLDSHQRVSDGGQLITKAANIGSPTRGYLDAPGAFEQNQLESRRPVTKTIHDKGLPVPSSATRMDNIDSSHAVMYEARNKSPTTSPTTTAGNAFAAGFGGVEIHAANRHLFEKFVSDSVNTRTDKFGGRIDSTPRETYGYVVNKLCG